MPKNGPFWRVFWKPKACGQTVLPDRSVLIGQKLVGKCQNSKWDILSNFQTMWPPTLLCLLCLWMTCANYKLEEKSNLSCKLIAFLKVEKQVLRKLDGWLALAFE